MVAIIKTENDWLEVIGAQRKKNGWIKNDGVSLRQEDVAVAILVSKALAEKNEEKRMEKIEAIINNTAFRSSGFIPELQQMCQFDSFNPEHTEQDST